jgi:hypothetical protein
MSRDSLKKTKSWVQELPRSQMLQPTRASERVKYALWRIMTPITPVMRNATERTGIRKRYIRHPKGRQNFLLGHVAPGRSARELVEHLIKEGYGNHFLAWRDDGQEISLRLLENFTYQYHLRIFADGEIRGHYEVTPESHPIRHLHGKGQIDY